ncbi:MAG: cadherin repeat domain-containing protein, partial [Planctomycetaceae bacterium]|nr:cadherin repeat domain-containing protein [Planctomycetaceae bacterium]
IDSVTGVVTVAGAIDREAAASYDIVVRATSTDTSFTTQTFTVAISDLNEFSVTAPSDADAANNAVDENSAIGTTVGLTANATDNDATTNSVTYSLVDSDSGNFAIDSNTGLVTVNAALDRETLGANRSITVRATSVDGSTNDAVFTISINDVDEFDVTVPVDTDATVNAVDENSVIGTTVGIIASASDVDATTNGVTYSLVDSDSGNFAIDGTTGIVTVNAALNRETLGATRSITVRATSADGSTSDTVFTV